MRMTALSLNCGNTMLRDFTQQTCFHKSLCALASNSKQTNHLRHELHRKLLDAFSHEAVSIHFLMRHTFNCAITTLYSVIYCFSSALALPQPTAQFPAQHVSLSVPLHKIAWQNIKFTCRIFLFFFPAREQPPPRLFRLPNCCLQAAKSSIIHWLKSLKWYQFSSLGSSNKLSLLL